MNLFHPQIAAALAATISLAACIAPPAAPTIPVAPGPSKTLDMFGADQAACQQNAAAQLSPAVAAANNQAVGGALLGGALGAGLGAGIGAAAGNAGKGAAIGAASGGALGIIGNADGAPYPQKSCSSSTTSCTGSAWPPTGILSPASPCPRRRALFCRSATARAGWRTLSRCADPAAKLLSRSRVLERLARRGARGGPVIALLPRLGPV